MYATDVPNAMVVIIILNLYRTCNILRASAFHWRNVSLFMTCLNAVERTSAIDTRAHYWGKGTGNLDPET